MAKHAHPLVSRFAEARLPLEIAAGPFASRSADIVQLDIAREAARRGRGERFRLWPGHSDNRVEVVNADRRIMQLVLLVHEPRRSFEVQVPRSGALPLGTRILREDRRGRTIESWTTASKRHFLCGMDEQHLFVALLPDPVSTVRRAHESLLDPRVTAAEHRAPQPTVRQGEWFFVALAQGELRDVEAEVGRGLRIRKHVGIAQAAGIRRVGRPHNADEVFVSAARRDTDGSAVAYVRGSVRHPDHKTVTFHDWRRVVPNREALAQPVPGVPWID